MSEGTRNSSPLLIGAAWLLVVLPLAWGVFKSGQNVAKLFTTPTVSAVALSAKRIA